MLGVTAWKGSALGMATYVQQKAKEAGTTLKQKDWSKHQEALQRVLTKASECVPTLSTSENGVCP